MYPIFTSWFPDLLLEDLTDEWRLVSCEEVMEVEDSLLLQKEGHWWKSQLQKNQALTTFCSQEKGTPEKLHIKIFLLCSLRNPSSVKPSLGLVGKNTSTALPIDSSFLLTTALNLFRAFQRLASQVRCLGSPHLKHTVVGPRVPDLPHSATYHYTRGDSSVSDSL